MQARAIWVSRTRRILHSLKKRAASFPFNNLQKEAVEIYMGSGSSPDILLVGLQRVGGVDALLAQGKRLQNLPGEWPVHKGHL